MATPCFAHHSLWLINTPKVASLPNGSLKAHSSTGKPVVNYMQKHFCRQRGGGLLGCGGLVPDDVHSIKASIRGYQSLDLRIPAIG